MTSIQKKTLYVLAAVILTFAIFFLGKSKIVDAAKQDGKKFEDWIVKCNEIKQADDKMTEFCSVNQYFSKEIDGKNHEIGHFQFFYTIDTKELIMLQNFATYINQGIRVDAGTSLLVKEKMIVPARFILCSGQSCTSKVKVTEDEMKTLLGNETINTVFLEAQGKQVHIPLSTKGLNKALNYIK